MLVPEDVEAAISRHGLGVSFDTPTGNWFCSGCREVLISDADAVTMEISPHRMWVVHRAEAVLDEITPEISEGNARAYDKGYLKGQEDGEHWPRRTLGHLPLDLNENPFRLKPRPQKETP